MGCMCQWSNVIKQVRGVSYHNDLKAIYDWLYRWKHWLVILCKKEHGKNSADAVRVQQRKSTKSQNLLQNIYYDNETGFMPHQMVPWATYMQIYQAGRKQWIT
jgi:outer membrane receptor for Fe3+-dicitrate